MVITTAAKFDSVKGLSFIDDFVYLILDSLLPMREITQREIHERSPEIIDLCISLLECQKLSSFTSILDLIGETFHHSEALCSRAVQTPGFCLTQKFQRMIIYGDTEHKKKTLWVVNNIILNSL